jgi:DNA-binding NarL/FixJ family response regulator
MEVRAGELLAVIERVAAGKTVDMVEHRTILLAAVRASTDLTDRDVTILDLIGAGLSNQEIAEELYLSINTVKTYIRTAYRRIGVQKRSEAVLWAVHHGLAPAPK